MKVSVISITVALFSATWAIAATSSVTFQNGVNGYNGTFDRYISEVSGTDATGSAITDFTLNGRNGTGKDAQGLIRFADMFGDNPDQIPVGARILDAQLQLATFGGVNGNATNGPYGVAGLLADFDSNTTYSSYSSSDPLGRGAWYEDGHATRPIGGLGRTFAGEVAAASVTSLVQRWSDDPLTNRGFVVQAGFPGLNDEMRIFTTGHSVPQAHPKLTVTYTTDPVQISTFQSAANGYTSGTMALLVGPVPGGAAEITSNGASVASSTLQLGDSSSAERLALIKFGNVFGSAVGQAPADKPVTKAWLVLTTTNSTNARSQGPFDAYAMGRNWTTSTLRSQLGPTASLQFSEGDISPTLSRARGMITGSEVWFDVTSYLEGVRNGAADYGLAVFPRDADGWTLFFNGAVPVSTRPRLVVASQLSSGLPGDFNNDTKVDAADYVAWRKGAVPSTPENYNLWRANFGATGSTVSQEPTTILDYDLAVVGQTQGASGALATHTAAGVTGLNLNRGPGLIPAAPDPLSSITNGFSANNWTNRAADGGTVDRNRAIAMGDYFEFGFALDVSHTASLSSLDLSLRRSAINAPSHFEVQASLDGFATPGITVSTFNYFGREGAAPILNPALSDPFIYMTTDAIGRPDTNFSPSDPIPTIDLGSIPELQNLAAGATVTFRLYGWNDGSSSSANSNTVAFRVTGPKVMGFVTAVPGFARAVPEPCGTLLLGLLPASWIAFGRRRRILKSAA